MRREIVVMVAIGAVIGWVLGYYSGVTWASLVVLVCLMLSSGFIYGLLVKRGQRKVESKKEQMENLRKLNEKTKLEEK